MPLNDSLDLEHKADHWNKPVNTGVFRTSRDVIQRKEIILRRDGKVITIDEETLKEIIRGVFQNIYAEELPYVAEYIASIIKDFQFIEDSNLALPEYDIDSKAIKYSSNVNGYEKIPDMKEDFGSKISSEAFVSDSFISVMIHEFGHYIQENFLDQHLHQLGQPLFEHYNVLFHENSYPGRNRGYYDPFDEENFKMFFNADSYWKNLLYSNPEKIANYKKERNAILHYINLLREPISVNASNFFSLIEKLKKGTKDFSNGLNPKQGNSNINTLRQMEVFLLILDKLEQTPKKEIRQTHFNFLRSLLISLLSMPSTNYKWFVNMFLPVMNRVFRHGEFPTQEATLSGGTPSVVVVIPNAPFLAGSPFLPSSPFSIDFPNVVAMPSNAPFLAGSPFPALAAVPFARDTPFLVFESSNGVVDVPVVPFSENTPAPRVPFLSIPMPDDLGNKKKKKK